MEQKTINEWCKEIHEVMVSKGFYDNPTDFATKMMLVVTEIAEAVEDDRKGNYDHLVEEMADVVIRMFDVCGFMNLDLEGAIEAKMSKNRKRPYKHGKRY